MVALALVLSMQPFSLHGGLAASSTPSPALLRDGAAGGPTPAPPVQSTAAATGTATSSPTATSAPATATSTARPVPRTTTPATATSTGLPAPELDLPRHYVVLIVIDSNRPQNLTLYKLPHIQALMRHGVVYDRSWVGELESSTPDVHVTLGTGTLPRENGFLGFGWASPQTRQPIDFRTLLANHGIDPVLRALPVQSVAYRLHEYMPQAVSLAASGHKDYAVVGLGGGWANYEIYGKYVGNRFIPTFMHTPPPLSGSERRSLTLPKAPTITQEDSWAGKYVVDVAQRVRPRLLMINFPELDTWGHWYGPDSQAVQGKIMRNVDRVVGQIEATYQRLGILQKTDFIVTADHAMMESRPAHSFNLVQSAAIEAGTKEARNDSEGGAVWLVDPAKAKDVAERLVAKRPAHVEAILYRSATGLTYHYVLASPVRWLVNPHVATALQDLTDTTAGRNGPDVWVLYHENYSVVPRNIAGTWKGTHGGPTWKVQHIPLIISGPDVRQGVHSQFPARSIDIAPTMERLLGLPPIQRDGVILADALQAPKSAEVKGQQAIASALTADVTALQQQSAADVRAESPWNVASPVLHCHILSAGGIAHACSNAPNIASNE